MNVIIIVDGIIAVSIAEFARDVGFWFCEITSMLPVPDFEP